MKHLQNANACMIYVHSPKLEVTQINDHQVVIASTNYDRSDQYATTS